MSELLFGAEIGEIAKQVMAGVDPEFESQFVSIANAINNFPELAPKYKQRNASEFEAREYLEARATSYVKARKSSADPTKPSTVPDEAVSLILREFYKVSAEDLPQIAEQHQWSMAAENKVGELLERYLLTVLEPMGWAWCAGSSVKKVDFVYEPTSNDEDWILLQVKNRDNSENSSSSSVRDGTTITKWFRSFSRKRETNWSEFPIENAADRLSEEDFRQFVIDYFA